MAAEGGGITVSITFNDTKKDLPSEQLQKLFVAAGWSDGSETLDMIHNYNIPWVNSSLVVSAWANEQLVGAVRVLSDTMFRSIIKVNHDVFLSIPCKLFSQI